MDARMFSGTLDMMVLDVVSRASSYGYEIAQTVMDRSAGTFELKEGSLYPALHRLERQRLVSSYWVDSDEGRRRKYYKVTAAGAKALAAKREEWQRFSAGVDGVLKGAAHGMA
jgi:PadR family transcriptional regulator PadR